MRPIAAILLCLQVLLVGACGSSPNAKPTLFNPGLRSELLDMEARDQEVRSAPASDRPEDRARMERWKRVDAENLARLQQILNEHGWPTRDLVGSDGARAAWVLAQHADVDPQFQRRCLEHLRGAHGRGQAPGPAVAYLTDRVLMNEGRPQVYGTQFTSLSGEPTPYEIENPAGLDERRISTGLPPMAEYQKMVREMLGRMRGAP